MRRLAFCMNKQNTLPFFFAETVAAMEEKCVLVDKTKGRMFGFLMKEGEHYPYYYGEKLKLVYNELDIDTDAAWVLYVYTDEEEIKDADGIIFISDSYIRNAKALKNGFPRTIRGCTKETARIVLTDYSPGRYGYRAIINVLGKEAEELDVYTIPLDALDRACDMDLDVSNRIKPGLLSRSYRRFLRELYSFGGDCDKASRVKLRKTLRV